MCTVINNVALKQCLWHVYTYSEKYKDLLKAADNSNGGKSHTRAGGWRQGRRRRGERGG